jgi:pimeloyl-ACP methyl ester carboxylesterase
VEEAVVLGTSLGANTALEMALAAPERLRGMVIEMPVLDNALLASALLFTPLMVRLTSRSRSCGSSVVRRGWCHPAWCRGRPTSWSTSCARSPDRAPRSSRGCSSAASRRTGTSAGRCERLPW